MTLNFSNVIKVLVIAAVRTAINGMYQDFEPRATLMYRIAIEPKM
jgi:hypothetical protein